MGSIISRSVDTSRCFTLTGDRNGSVYVINVQRHTIHRIDTTNGQVKVVAGLLNVRGMTDGTSTSAHLWEPNALVANGKDSIYFGDGSTPRKVDLATGSVTTIACVCNNGWYPGLNHRA